MSPFRMLLLTLLGEAACVTRHGLPDKPPVDSAAVATGDTATFTVDSDTGTPVAPPPCEPITKGSVWSQDKDGDCLDAMLDCDDLDPAVNNTDEVCDGKDNDCNGGIDDGVLPTWYLDVDGDGYAGEEVQTCSMPEPWLSTGSLGTDCDDTDATIHPEEPEAGTVTGIDIPGDGIDQDCDGADACGPVCVGYDCGFSTTTEAEAFCDTWTQAAYIETLAPGPDFSVVDCLCTPPVDVVIGARDGTEPSLAGLEAWFPTETLKIEGGSQTFAFPGLEGVREIPATIRIQCSGSDPTAFDVRFDGLADVERLGGLEFGDWGYGCYNTDTAVDLTGLDRVSTIDGNLDLYHSQLQTLHGLEALERVGGYLSVRTNPSLTDLTSLAGLRTVGGGMYVSQAFDDLSSLTGLESVGGDLLLAGRLMPEFVNLRTVGGLYLYGFDTLTLEQFSWVTSFTDNLVVGSSGIGTLVGLEGLGAVGGWVVLSDNPSLSSLDGLASLTTIGRDLGVGENPSLTTLTGLSALTTVGGDVEITDNDALTTLDGLSALTDVSGTVLVEGNALLTLDTPIPLARIGGTLEVVDGPALTSLDALTSLRSIAGHLVITNNDQLTSLAGLYGLRSVGGDVRFEGNASLTQDEIYAFLDHLGRENIGLKVVVER